MTHDDATTPRAPGAHLGLPEREKLLADVERALLDGARTPAAVLELVPALGTWDTAKAHLRRVRARWAACDESRALREARGELVATVRTARARVLIALETTDPPEMMRLARELDRLVRTETFLLGMDPAKIRPEENDPIEKRWQAARRADRLLDLEEFEARVASRRDRRDGSVGDEAMDDIDDECAECEEEECDEECELFEYRENPSSARTEFPNPTNGPGDATAEAG
jgi:hypothetical protein